MNGVDGESFAPNSSLTRGMMAQILYNMEGRPAVSGRTDFRDVLDSDWYLDAVTWAKNNGIVSGYDSAHFGPEDSVTRAQAAVMLKNYADWKGRNTSDRAELSFRDAGSVPTWASDALAWGVASGLLQGSDGNLKPNGTATRGEIAAILSRYLSE